MNGTTARIKPTEHVTANAAGGLLHRVSPPFSTPTENATCDFIREEWGREFRRLSGFSFVVSARMSS